MVDLRTYLYVSDAKVDMYLDQLTIVEKSRLATSLGINLGILSVSLEAEKTAQSNRISRLDAVEDVLRREKNVGTIDSDSSWIGGVANVAAAAFTSQPDLMFFFSSSPDLFLGLAGSAHHIIGNVRPTTATTTFSYQHSLLGTLSTVARSMPYVIEKDDSDLSNYVHIGVTHGMTLPWVHILMALSDQFDEAPKQRVDFMARRLVSGVDSRGRKYTLATPLHGTDR